IARRLRRALDALPADPPATRAPLQVGIGDARDLSAIPAAAVDYVFLDPPYHGKVQYSELNFLWEAWLGACDDWRADDLVVNAARGQALERWDAGMACVVRACARVCKPGAWLTLTYVPAGDTTPDRLWRVLGEAGFARQAGFDGVVVNRQRTYVQRTSRATAVDQVVHFRRTR
ncbi:MAG: hypothetical protein FJ029_03610, partial [Actinobacteria bacterium]|nr:hypothetical protein [Actinomycetota bacterium]